MKEIPILFSTMMVQANLEDRKGMTRRSMKNQFTLEDDEYWKLYVDAKGALHAIAHWKSNDLPVFPAKSLKCPYGKPGDMLWVRESWQWIEGFGGSGIYVFKTDNNTNVERWRPSIHMPKEAARIWLEVTNVRIERLQDISEEDAIAEGVKKRPGSDSSTRFDYRHYPYEHSYNVDAKVSFRTLWQSINGDDSWVANPWVWVISYKILSKTGKPDLQKIKSIA